MMLKIGIGLLIASGCGMVMLAFLSNAIAGFGSLFILGLFLVLFGAEM